MSNIPEFLLKMEDLMSDTIKGASSKIIVHFTNTG